MKCPNCGKEIAEDSLFCEFCGAKIEKESANKFWTPSKICIGLIAIAILVGLVIYVSQPHEVQIETDDFYVDDDAKIESVEPVELVAEVVEEEEVIQETAIATPVEAPKETPAASTKVPSAPKKAPQAAPVQAPEETPAASTKAPSAPKKAPQAAPVEEEDEIIYTYAVVDVMPEFPGGMDGLVKFLSENVRYPVVAQENAIQGRVICQFVVNKNGDIVNVEVARTGGDASLDKEAVRVIKSMPKWKPGEMNGKLVSVRYSLPINFSLQ